MDIISCGVQKVRPQVKAPQILLECECGCVYNININTESKRKKWDNKQNMFIWETECPICHKTIPLGVACKTKEKALAYFFLQGDNWI